LKVLTDSMVLLFLCPRKRLFFMINDLPSVFEAFVDRKHSRDRSGVDSSGKSRHSSKVAYSFLAVVQFCSNFRSWKHSYQNGDLPQKWLLTFL
jgi:hypothetical protein